MSPRAISARRRRASLRRIDPPRLIHGDCLRELPRLPSNSVDTCVTDPPYELGFMGKSWDSSGIAFDPATWRAVSRVLRPGGFLLCFGGTRTFHRVACAIEDAGFELRDCMMWLYGSGFPKSLDVSKAIDKRGGDPLAWRAVSEAAPATDAAKLWDGWGTALKPAWEPIIVAMKPTDGTFAENALQWGVAGMHIDGGRVPSGEDHREKCESVVGLASNRNGNSYGEWKSSWKPGGRFPANLLLDEAAAVLLDEQSGHLAGPGNKATRRDHGASDSIFGMGGGAPTTLYDRGGGASRFFYVAKAGKKERGEGNDHPTVKPLKLMEYLCTLTRTPTGGTVLDPFLGSGTTALAALNTGRGVIGIERDEQYFEIARKRVAAARPRRLSA